ncbi:peroxisomal membrane protein 11A isoform X1 [Scyliorhinus torazame]|uniref:peroxisomal membrane protein 11A isoform X1 n=1 Tax=Scyliorhinus torazame TaxID=75743 RepID=UPI003B592046
MFVCATRHPGGPRCYFCSQQKHPRQRCPAHAALCKACGKKGHFAAVCQARAVAAIAPTLLAYPHWAPPSSSTRTTRGQWAPPSSPPRTTCGQWAPPSSPPRTTCVQWAPQSSPPGAPHGQWAPPSSPPGATYGQWATPSSPPQSTCGPWRRHLVQPPQCAAHGRRHFVPRRIFRRCHLVSPTGHGHRQHSRNWAPQAPHHPTSVTIDQSRRHNLATASTSVKINGHVTSITAGLRKHRNFIYPDTVRRCSLAVHPANQRISLASGYHSGAIRWFCTVTLTVQGVEFSSFCLFVLPNLCAA